MLEFGPEPYVCVHPSHVLLKIVNHKSRYVSIHPNPDEPKPNWDLTAKDTQIVWFAFVSVAPFAAKKSLLFGQ